KIPELQNVPVISLSANAFEFDRQQSLMAGCNDFIAKPIQVPELLTKIQEYLKVSWIYDTLCPESIEMEVKPPPEELIYLYNAVKIGDIEVIEQQIFLLQQLYPEAAYFINKLQVLAANFEYEKLIVLLDINNSSSPEN
ncbi:MAG: hybrid sensor histidine kinase/response regulator, partial [Nostocaceae cyanobacterium]|nr:hybrid sensor histidine kinase/response regulator [Nostocaceae cyanobacterium]